MPRARPRGRPTRPRGKTRAGSYSRSPAGTESLRARREARDVGGGALLDVDEAEATTTAAVAATAATVVAGERVDDRAVQHRVRTASADAARTAAAVTARGRRVRASGVTAANTVQAIRQRATATRDADF